MILSQYGNRVETLPPIQRSAKKMKINDITEQEIDSLRIWADAEEPLTTDQQMMCIALDRLGCRALPSEIAAYCNTTEDRILALKRGIRGILIDANTGGFWVR